MKLIEIAAVICVSLICILCYLIVSVNIASDTASNDDGVILVNSDEFERSLKRESAQPGISGGNEVILMPETEVTLTLAVCRNDSERITESITMLKSVMLFLMDRHIKLRVIGFVDKDARSLFTKKIKYLRLQGEALDSRVTIEIKPTWFPADTVADWNQLCSAQRLFFPSLLPNTDAVIYLDPDVLLLDDLSLLWRHFAYMNETQFLGMAAEGELPANGWYNTKAKFPYYGPRGVNAGVMLMNLTRMRAAHFEHRVHDIFKSYRNVLHSGDQDILNIYLHFRPENLYLLPCEWNYRMNHCECFGGGGECTCKAAEDKGASLFHGNKEIFLKSKYQFSTKFYQVFNKYDLLNGSTKDLIEKLSNTFSPKSGAKCKKVKSILMRKIREHFEEIENEPFLDFSSGS